MGDCFCDRDTISATRERTVKLPLAIWILLLLQWSSLGIELLVSITSSYHKFGWSMPFTIELNNKLFFFSKKSNSSKLSVMAIFPPNTISWPSTNQRAFTISRRLRSTEYLSAAFQTEYVLLCCSAILQELHGLLQVLKAGYFCSVFLFHPVSKCLRKRRKRRSQRH